MTSLFSIFGSIFVAVVTSNRVLHSLFKSRHSYSVSLIGTFGILFAITCLFHIIYKGFENSTNFNKHSLLSIINISLPNIKSENLKLNGMGKSLKTYYHKTSNRKRYWALLVRFYYIFIYLICYDKSDLSINM